MPDRGRLTGTADGGGREPRSRAAGAGRPAVLAVALGALLADLVGGLASVDAYSLTSVLLAGAGLTPAACPVAALSGRNDRP
ncbi:hypothetical protein [Streptomyces lateritius]|uniref:hypothetical protein n=1 Tax=Streptomyces lateritius TaxID=67313 RepID=UPI001C8C79AE|nr:hypothetical protein [Streptomyces lateritius]MBX9424262.1 hypothetical protein [Streptomyces lateritius]